MLSFFLFKVLTPSINQYNINDKIRQANELNIEENVERQSQPKVRFKDSLVEFEPEEEGEESIEIMENFTDSKKTDESSDDGYIDEEVIDLTVEEKEESENDERMNNDKAYSKEDFDEEDEETKLEANESTPQEAVTEAAEQHESDSPDKASNKSSVLRPRSSKVSPNVEKVSDDSRKIRKICCFYKDTDEYKQKLPNYNGFNSNYGLSKDEITKREFVQSKHKQFHQYKQMQQMEHEEFMASVNEEAFSKW